MDIPNWDLIASFRAVAEKGSLSAAAHALGLTQPTVGRHVRQLEARLQTQLFTRQPRGLSLTPAGEALLPSAIEMSAAAHRFTQAAVGKQDTLTGTVRITTSVVLAHYHMPDIIHEICKQAPGLEIELNATDSAENLLFGDADIAVRMFRPNQLELVTRPVGSLAIGLYAAKKYIAERGVPEEFSDFASHRFIGYDTSDLILRGMNRIGYPATRKSFAIRCDNHAVYWQMVRAGCGIGVGQVSVARKTPGVVQILEDIDLPELPVWIATSRHIRNSGRLRLVADILFDSLKTIIDGNPVQALKSAPSG